jgi:cytochrome P450
MPEVARTEPGEVRWCGELRAWLVAGHEPVVRALRSADYVAAPGGSRNLQGMDGAEHARCRALIAGGFSAGAVAALVPSVGVQVAAALDRAEPGGTFDVMRELAWPVAMGAMCRVLGIPASAAPALTGWTQEVAAAMGSPPTPAVPLVLERVDGLLSRLVAERRGGLIGSLAGRLDDQAVVTMARLLLFAGSHPTALAIGNACLALVQHPALLGRVRRQPGLLAAAIEESLRLETVIQVGTPRRAARAASLCGHRIREDDHVLPLYGRANRDASRFAHPDRLDVTRARRPHLAFGWGRHACPAPGLARLLLRVSIARLLDRFPRLELAAAPELVDSPVTRGPRLLPLRT